KARWPRRGCRWRLGGETAEAASPRSGRSARATDGLSHSHGLHGLRDVMRTEDMGSLHDTHRRGGQGAGQTMLRVVEASNRPDEGFARYAYADRVAERPQATQSGEDRAVPLMPGDALSSEEPDARVQDDLLRVDTGSQGEIETLPKETLHAL